jgi:hypothetical protein
MLCVSTLETKSRDATGSAMWQQNTSAGNLIGLVGQYVGNLSLDEQPVIQNTTRASSRGDGMEWNGMEWNGMEWNVLVRLVIV